MARDYASVLDWWNDDDPKNAGIPWGEVDYGQDPGHKVDSPRKSIWGTNRAVNVLIPAQIAALNDKLDRILAKLGA